LAAGGGRTWLEDNTWAATDLVWAGGGLGRAGSCLAGRRWRGAPRAPVAADGVRLRHGLVDEQRPGGVEEDQEKENDGRRPWLGARESFLAVVLHWTVAAHAVGEHEGATTSGKHSTRVHEARQGEEEEVNGEVLGMVRRPAGRVHARRRMAHAQVGACPGQRGPAHRRGARLRRAEGPTSGHRFTTEVPGHPYAGGRSIRCMAKPEIRRARAWRGDVVVSIGTYFL
jgi:hypothetical protein